MMTQRQELFCLAYIETGNASKAYRQAYNTERMKPATVNRKAKESMDNGKITARIEELRASVREEAQVTLEGHLNDLKALRDAAQAAEQFGAAINAEVARGKAAGLYVKRQEFTGVAVEVSEPENDLSRLTEEELQTLAELVEKMQAVPAADDKPSRS
jgi:phage terminase small subunit